MDLQTQKSQNKPEKILTNLHLLSEEEFCRCTDNPSIRPAPSL